MCLICLVSARFSTLSNLYFTIIPFLLKRIEYAREHWKSALITTSFIEVINYKVRWMDWTHLTDFLYSCKKVLISRFGQNSVFPDGKCVRNGVSTIYHYSIISKGLFQWSPTEASSFYCIHIHDVIPNVVAIAVKMVMTTLIIFPQMFLFWFSMILY